MNLNTLNVIDYNQLFSSLPANKSNNIFTNINLGDYASLKSGTYKKLLKNYYSETQKEQTKETKKTKTKEIDETLESAKSKASNFINSLNKETIKEEDIENFIENYNDLKSEKTKNGGINAAISGLVSFTEKNSDQLAKIGIKFDKKNNLTFDKEIFKNTSEDDIKEIFNNYKTQAKSYVNRIKSYATQNSQKTTYNSNAIYTNNQNNGLNFNGFF